MLRNIINGTTESSIIIIQDAVEKRGQDLFSILLQQNMMNSKCNIHVFCLENSVKFWKDTVQNSHSNTYYHDLFTDLRGWNKDIEDSGGGSCVDQKEKSNDLKGRIQDMKCPNNDNIVFFDSLSLLCWNFGTSWCYRELHKLCNICVNGNATKKIVCLMHEDVMPDVPSSLQNFKHLSSTFINMISVNKHDKTFIVNIKHRKKGGKVIKEENKCKLLDDMAVHCEVLKEKNFRNEIPEETGKKLPEELTTFKISLKDNEKEARDKLILPYIRNEDSHSGGGQVFYQPDAADDWDEEDPDDDLDV